MKYKDKDTLLIQSKHQSKETNQYGFPFKSDREIRRKRKKQLFEFWSKNLKGFLPEDFWNALDLNEHRGYNLLLLLNFEILTAVKKILLNISNKNIEKSYKSQES